MSETIEEVKRPIHTFLRANCEPVPSKSASSNKVHLEVWKSKGRSQVVGIEFDHDEVVNLWVTHLNVPKNLPSSIRAVHKEPKDRTWNGDDGKGANSNLSAYQQFRTRPITRFGVTNATDALVILNHLIR